ncbi:uncharacterized protein LOC113466557 [Diaphorina citri]|uniref:Uncharacterized protein LOC113466557 n=1 Tax=Diaphorina citri TaxID=121845 RepID=A0A3Q0INK7_DIACI|nr:uncharacterized protein LOC113466557 [Diaphorina citri]
MATFTANSLTKNVSVVSICLVFFLVATDAVKFSTNANATTRTKVKKRQGETSLDQSTAASWWASASLKPAFPDVAGDPFFAAPDPLAPAPQISETLNPSFGSSSNPSECLKLLPSFFFSAFPVYRRGLRFLSALNQP